MQIIHIDMDAFFAAVEIRDNLELAGKPVIIGALPGQRGVVATCSYEARKFGVRSAMPISEAYRRCPHGIYLTPNGRKYYEASQQIRKIWDDYTDICEYISLDEGFLDVTGSAHLFGGADAVAYEIKRRTVAEVGLTCSVGIGYSMMSAKLASEENKPDGFFKIPAPADLMNLIADRNVRVIYGVGAKTAAELARFGIITVRHIHENRDAVAKMFGKHGRQIVDLADGIDDRRVEPYAEQKSIGKEHTFQTDITDFDYLQDVLLLIARRLSFELRVQGIYCCTVTVKATYANANMQSVTRAKTGDATNRTRDIYETAVALLDKIEKRAVRLIGISVSGLTDTLNAQLSLFDTEESNSSIKQDKVGDAMLKLQLKYGRGIVKTLEELQAEKRTQT